MYIGIWSLMNAGMKFLNQRHVAIKFFYFFFAISGNYWTRCFWEHDRMVLELWLQHTASFGPYYHILYNWLTDWFALLWL